jgi:hypothetical protein
VPLGLLLAQVLLPVRARAAEPGSESVVPGAALTGSLW